MIAGKDNDRHAVGPRPVGLLQTGEFDRQLLKTAERSGGLGEFALTGDGRVAMDRRNAGALLVDPLG